MSPSADQPSGNLPTPAPLGPETPKEPPLKVLLRQRFFLVALLILLFFGALFALGKLKGRTSSPELAMPVHKAAPAAQSPEVSEEVAPPGAVSSEPPAEPPPTGKEHGAAVKEGTPLAKPAPVEEAAPPTAPAPLAAPPPPEVTVKLVRGEIFTRALIKIIDEQVNKPLFGWRPNTIVLGKMGVTDNVNNLQLGVLEVARRTIWVLNENLTRFAVTEAYNPKVNEAMNFLMVSPDKYWFPSASGKYREAIQDLERYIDDLQKGRSRFYPRVDHLIVLLTNYKDILGSCFHNLIKDTEADGTPVSWSRVDDYFYFSQGVTLAMSQMLEAVKEDFHDQLLKKGSHKLLDDAIHALHTASQLRPWLVTDAAKDGILANHRANLSTYIGEAEHVVSTLQTMLATN